MSRMVRAVRDGQWTLHSCMRAESTDGASMVFSFTRIDSQLALEHGFGVAQRNKILGDGLKFHKARLR